MRDNLPNHLTYELSMGQKKVSGSGRLVPTRPTGLQYEVQYGMYVLAEIRPHGQGGLQPTRWAKCTLRSAHAQRIPDGSYFLHAEDGRVHQLKSADGEWSYLALTVWSTF